MKFNLQSPLQYITFFYDLILPSQCLLCHLPSNGKLLCDDCKDALTLTRNCCQHCGLPLAVSQPFCGDCLKKKHFFTQLYALADYQAPFPELIKNFKYGKQLIIGELLSELLVGAIASHIAAQRLSEVDYILPVPLHKKKVQQRGFNQAQLLAEKVAKQFNISLLLNAVSRQKQTLAQESLSFKKRKSNLKDAFIVSEKQKNQLFGSYVVIIDDVVTTGSTVDSLSQVLLQAGVKRIDIWCICRTALPR